MKKSTLQNLAMYLLAGVLAFLLNRANGCQNKAPTSPHYIMSYDTVTQYVEVEGPQVVKTRVVVKRDTVFDVLILEEPAEQSTVTYEATHPMQRNGGAADTMLLYEGQKPGQDGKCTFRYTIGIAHDSLRFVNIEAECPKDVQYVTVEVPAMPSVSPLPYAPRPWRVGAKFGWSPLDRHQMYGAQAMWRTIYASVNYTPASPGVMFEAGILLPIGKKRYTFTPTYGHK